MVADSFRFLLVGKETIEGVPATVYRRVPFVDDKSKSEQKPLKTNEYVGSLARALSLVRLNRNGKVGVDVLVRIQDMPLLMQSPLHAPTAVAVAGFTAASATQYVVVGGTTMPTGGTFNVTINGYTTPEMAYNVSTANMQSYLRNLPGMASAITVSGTAGISYAIAFGGNLASANIPAMSADGTNLTGGTGMFAAAGQNAQTLTLGTAAPTAGSFTIQIPGIGTTAAISPPFTTAVLLAAAVQSALQALPGMAGNAYVAGVSTTVCTILLKGNQETLVTATDARYLMTCPTNTLASPTSTTTVTAASVLGAGFTDYYMKMGASAKPTFTIIEFNGVDLAMYPGMSANTWTLDQPNEGSFKLSLEGPSKYEVHMPYNPSTAASGNVLAGGWATTVTATAAVGTAQVFTPAAVVGNVYNVGAICEAVNSDGFTNREQIQITAMSVPTWTVSTGASASAGTFTLTYGGQTTAAIAYNASASAVLVALQTLTSLLGCTIAVTGTLASSGGVTITLTANTGYSRFDQALTGTVVTTLTGGGLVIASTTTLTATFTATKGASWILRGIPIPAAVQYPYQQPLDPTQIGATGFTVNGVALATMLSFKVMGKNNRSTLWPLGTGSPDVVRSTEGDVEASGEMVLRFLALAGSLYQAWQNSVTPGPFVITHTDTSYTVQGVNPVHEITVPLPKLPDAVILSMKAETQQSIKFDCLLDLVSNTPFKLRIRNESWPNAYAAS